MNYLITDRQKMLIGGVDHDSARRVGNTSQNAALRRQNLTTKIEAHADFLYIIDFHGYRVFQSRKMIHNLTLYHSDSPFDQTKMSALFALKILWGGSEKWHKA